MKNKGLILLLFINHLTTAHETRKQVIILDSGLSPTQLQAPYICKDESRDFTGHNIIDQHGHGTNIVSLIAKRINQKTYCIVMLKWLQTTHMDTPPTAYVAALDYAIHLPRGKFINLSLGGDKNSNLETQLLEKFLLHGGTIAVAAGNDHVNLDIKCTYFPACSITLQKYSNFHVIGSLNSRYQRSTFSNYGKIVTNWELGENQCDSMNQNCLTGTSQATANFIAYSLSHLH